MVARIDNIKAQEGHSSKRISPEDIERLVEFEDVTLRKQRMGDFLSEGYRLLEMGLFASIPREQVLEDINAMKLSSNSKTKEIADLLSNSIEIRCPEFNYIFYEYSRLGAVYSFPKGAPGLFAGFRFLYFKDKLN